MKRSRVLVLAASLTVAGLGLGTKLMLAPAVLAAEPAKANDPVARAQAAVDKGVAFLKSQQTPEGAFVTQGPPALSAIALKAIVQHPEYDARTPWVKKGYEQLLAFQYESGGIYKDLLANYNTAIAVSSLAAAEEPAFKDRMDKAVSYLKSLQWTDTISGGPKGEANIQVGNPWYGGAGYGSHSRPDGSNTQLMLDALYDAGVPSSDPSFQAALKFVSRMQNRSESNDQPWAGNDGGAVYTPANNGESQAGEYVDANGKRLLRSYGSMTYGMLKSYIYAGLTKDDPRVKAAWDWIRANWTLEENPGMRLNDPANAEWGLLYYYHTLARALNVYDQPVITDMQGKKHDWRLELIEKLAAMQKPDGSWVGDAKWMENNPVLATSYATLALQEAIEDLKQHAAGK